MLIKFKKIVLNNFLSFGYSELDLTDGGYTLVSGINNNKDDLAKSNGSGKSSIWEAISWSLTGKTIRECKDIVNIYANDGAYVELEFSIDSDEYKVIRSKDHSKYKTNLKIFINGEDKSGKGIKDSEKLLAEYIPDLTSTLLGSVIILGQGLPQRFSNNTPSGRKDVLETLSKSDFMIEDIKNKLTVRKSDLSNQIRSFEDDNLICNTKLIELDKTLSQTESKLSELLSTDFNTKIIDLKEQLDKLNIEFNKKSKEYDEKIERLDNLRLEYSSVSNIKNNELLEINKLYADKIDIIKSDISKLSAEIAVNTSELNRLKNIKDICPTCGQKIPNIEKPDTTNLEQILLDLKGSINSKNFEISKLNKQLDGEKQSLLVKYGSKIEELELRGKVVAQEVKTLKQIIDNLTADKVTYQSSIAVAEQTKITIEDNIKNLKETLNSLNLEKYNLSNKILYINNIKEETQKRLEVVNRMYMIAIRDFRGFLLTNIIEFINKKSKEYCKDIFETDKLEFILDGNYINIFYDNKQYENLSGGEKQKVDLIVQFAIRDMLCKFLNFSSNIIVLDEIFDNLDSLGCQKVLNVISKKLSDIDSIYIVTHHSDIDLPIDNEIIVIKNENGISEIKQ
jgi:DNA repair exonuclease SbcCD ATPase subunit